MVVETPADVRAAERRLLRSLVKDTDGFMARHVERPISLAISRRLARTAITPNQMSLISIAVGICGGPFFLSSRPLMQTIGALLFLAHSILDGCDGELARLKFQQSRWGGILDFWGDNVVHTVIFGSMGVGWSLSAGALWPLALGAGAVLGTLGSAGFVYWRLMRGKDGADTLFTSVSDAPGRPLTRLLNSASRRDFIYLVILLALFGRSDWFLVLAGIGAPIYFLLVLFAAAPRGGAQRSSHAANRRGRGTVRRTVVGARPSPTPLDRDAPASQGREKMARLLSVNVGLPRDIPWQGKTVHTGIWKAPVEGRRMARRLNLDGDGQGDLAGHGGEHRAVFVYQIDSYRYWQARASTATTFLTVSSARISRLTACPTRRCASATITGSAARCSR